MCLSISNFSLHFNQFNQVVCYKVMYQKENGDLFSCYEETPYPSKGLFVSNRTASELDCIEQEDRRVRQGVHVFPELQDAIYEKEYHERYFLPDHLQYTSAVVIPVLCHGDDLVATGFFAGVPSAVFMKVEVLPVMEIK